MHWYAPCTNRRHDYNLPIRGVVGCKTFSVADFACRLFVNIHLLFGYGINKIFSSHRRGINKNITAEEYSLQK